MSELTHEQILEKFNIDTTFRQEQTNKFIIALALPKSIDKAVANSFINSNTGRNLMFKHACNKISVEELRKQAIEYLGGKPNDEATLETQLLEYMKSRKFRNFTNYDLFNALGISWNKSLESLGVLLKSKKPKIISKTLPYNKSQTKTLYKYCPEYYDLNDPKKSRLDVMCSLIKKLLLEFPDMNSSDIRRKVQAYLLGIDRVLISDAIHIMQETGFIIWTSGKHGAKHYRVNDNLDIRKAAKIRDEIMKTDRYKKYAL